MTNLSRRSLLTGLLSSAALVAAGPVAKVMPVDDGFGVGPAMQALRMPNAFLEGMSQRIETTIWYGNPDWLPAQFTGLIPNYSASIDGALEIVGRFPRNSDAGMVFERIA